MKLLTRDTDYAVRALAHIASKKDEVITVSELVRELDIPRPFLRKILQVLSRQGILKSIKGRGGGFKLLLRADEINLVKLIEIFQGPVEVSECLFRKKVCPGTATCKLKGIIDNIKKEVSDELESVTISKLLR